MDSFKIEHFKTEYPNIAFPECHSLDNTELLILQNHLFDKLSFKNRDLLELTKKLNDLASVIFDVNAENEDFCLSSVLTGKNIKPNRLVYLNWYRYDQIDKIGFADLEKYFDSIWYPISDDLDIFDDSYSWILSVSHDGVVSLLIFQKNYELRS